MYSFLKSCKILYCNIFLEREDHTNEPCTHNFLISGEKGFDLLLRSGLASRLPLNN